MEQPWRHARVDGRLALGLSVLAAIMAARIHLWSHQAHASDALLLAGVVAEVLDVVALALWVACGACLMKGLDSSKGLAAHPWPSAPALGALAGDDAREEHEEGPQRQQLLLQHHPPPDAPARTSSISSSAAMLAAVSQQAPLGVWASAPGADSARSLRRRSLARAPLADVLHHVARLGSKSDRPCNMEAAAASDKPGVVKLLWLCDNQLVPHLHSVLPSSRYRILTAHNGATLMAMLDTLPRLPDVVVLDLEACSSTSGDGGREAAGVLQAVRAAYNLAELPVITLGALPGGGGDAAAAGPAAAGGGGGAAAVAAGAGGQRQASHWALGNGANDHMCKPLDAAELDARIAVQVQLRHKHTLAREAAALVAGLEATMPLPLLHAASAGHAGPAAAQLAMHLQEVSLLAVGVHELSSLCSKWSTPHAVEVVHGLLVAVDNALAQHGCLKVEQCGGGGTVLAVAGHNGAPDHALRAMRAAAAVLTVAGAAGVGGERLQVRLGMHTGQAHSGVLGTRPPRFAVFGEAATAALALQARCAPGCLLVSGAAQSCVKAQQLMQQQLLLQQPGGEQQGVTVDAWRFVDLGVQKLRGSSGVMAVFLAKVGDSWQSAVMPAQQQQQQQPRGSLSSRSTQPPARATTSPNELSWNVPSHGGGGSPPSSSLGDNAPRSTKNSGSSSDHVSSAAAAHKQLADAALQKQAAAEGMAMSLATHPPTAHQGPSWAIPVGHAPSLQRSQSSGVRSLPSPPRTGTLSPTGPVSPTASAAAATAAAAAAAAGAAGAGAGASPPPSANVPHYGRSPSGLHGQRVLALAMAAGSTPGAFTGSAGGSGSDADDLRFALLLPPVPGTGAAPRVADPLARLRMARAQQALPSFAAPGPPQKQQPASAFAAPGAGAPDSGAPWQRSSAQRQRSFPNMRKEVLQALAGPPLRRGLRRMSLSKLPSPSPLRPSQAGVPGSDDPGGHLLLQDELWGEEVKRSSVPTLAALRNSLVGERLHVQQQLLQQHRAAHALGSALAQQQAAAAAAVQAEVAAASRLQAKQQVAAPSGGAPKAPSPVLSRMATATSSPTELSDCGADGASASPRKPPAVPSPPTSRGRVPGPGSEGIARSTSQGLPAGHDAVAAGGQGSGGAVQSGANDVTNSACRTSSSGQTLPMSTDSSVFHMQQPWGAAQHSSPTPLSSLLRYSVLVPATAGMMPRSESSVAADASASIESADARWNRQMQYVFSSPLRGDQPESVPLEAMSSNALFLGPYGGDYSTTPLTSVRPSAQPLGSNTRRVLQACTSQQLMMLHSSLANSARAATNTPAGEVLHQMTDAVMVALTAGAAQRTPGAAMRAAAPAPAAGPASAAGTATGSDQVMLVASLDADSSVRGTPHYVPLPLTNELSSLGGAQDGQNTAGANRGALVTLASGGAQASPQHQQVLQQAAAAQTQRLQLAAAASPPPPSSSEVELLTRLLLDALAEDRQRQALAPPPPPHQQPQHQYHHHPSGAINPAILQTQSVSSSAASSNLLYGGRSSVAQMASMAEVEHGATTTEEGSASARARFQQAFGVAGAPPQDADRDSRVDGLLSMHWAHGGDRGGADGASTHHAQDGGPPTHHHHHHQGHRAGGGGGESGAPGTGVLLNNRVHVLQMQESAHASSAHSSGGLASAAEGVVTSANNVASMTTLMVGPGSCDGQMGEGLRVGSASRAALEAALLLHQQGAGSVALGAALHAHQRSSMASVHAQSMSITFPHLSALNQSATPVGGFGPLGASGVSRGTLAIADHELEELLMLSLATQSNSRPSGAQDGPQVLRLGDALHSTARGPGSFGNGTGSSPLARSSAIGASPPGAGSTAGLPHLRNARGSASGPSSSASLGSAPIQRPHAATSRLATTHAASSSSPGGRSASNSKFRPGRFFNHVLEVAKSSFTNSSGGSSRGNSSQSHANSAAPLTAADDDQREFWSNDGTTTLGPARVKSATAGEAHGSSAGSAPRGSAALHASKSTGHDVLVGLGGAAAPSILATGSEGGLQAPPQDTAQSGDAGIATAPTFAPPAGSTTTHTNNSDSLLSRLVKASRSTDSRASGTRDSAGGRARHASGDGSSTAGDGAAKDSPQQQRRQPLAALLNPLRRMASSASQHPSDEGLAVDSRGNSEATLPGGASGDRASGGGGGRLPQREGPASNSASATTAGSGKAPAKRQSSFHRLARGLRKVLSSNARSSHSGGGGGAAGDTAPNSGGAHAS